jgi:hypothetical protein
MSIFYQPDKKPPPPPSVTAVVLMLNDGTTREFPVDRRVVVPPGRFRDQVRIALIGAKAYVEIDL